MSAPAVSSFDYATLAPDLAAAARGAAERIRSRLTSAYLDTGRDLLAIKERLNHGQFGGWLAAEFDMSHRTASRYMASAELAGKLDTVSNLPAATVYALTASTVSPAVRDAVLRRIASGDSIRAKDVAQMVSDLRLAVAHDPTVAKLREKRGRDSKNINKEETEAAQSSAENRHLQELVRRHEQEMRCIELAVEILVRLPDRDAAQLIAAFGKVGPAKIAEALKLALAGDHAARVP